MVRKKNQNCRLPPESAYYQSFFLLDNSDRRVKRTRQKSPHLPAGPKQTLHIPGNGSISCLHCEIGIFPFTLHVQCTVSYQLVVFLIYLIVSDIVLSDYVRS